MATQTNELDQGDRGDANLKAPKDRNCPFCKVAFTSSSLGRHLDLYIREKNPKPPDGIHDVDQIRKLRRGITRRHARTSKSHQQARQPVASPSEGEGAPSSSSETRADYTNGDGSRTKATSPLSPTTNEPLRDPTRDPIKTYLNKPSWQITGVINDLPPRANPYMREGAAAATPSSTGSVPLPPPHQQLNFDFTTKQKLAEEVEARQAAEYALREVLEGIHTSDARLRKEPLWDFDFFAQNWPALCLRLLEPSSLIFSSTPTAGGSKQGTWPIGPPKDIPNLWLVEKVARQFRAKGRRLAPFEEDVVSDEPCPQGVELTPEVNRHSGHVLTMEIDWLATPPERKEEVWRLEVLRYCAEQRIKREAAERKVEQVTAEAARLRWEVEALRSMLSQRGSNTTNSNTGVNNHQRPFVDPNRQPVATDVDVVRDLEARGTPLNSWEFDQLTSKWANAVRNKKRIGNAASNYTPGMTVTIGGGGEAVTISSPVLQTYAFSSLSGGGNYPASATNAHPAQPQSHQNPVNANANVNAMGADDDVSDLENEDDDENEGSDVDMADEDDDDDEPD